MKELALIGAALIASLLLGELLLRLMGVSYPVFIQTDPVLGAAHIPGARGHYRTEGESWLQINRDGMRGPEVSLEKPPGTYRIALLGDSYIEGVQVPFEKTVGEVIAARLSQLRGSPVEVLNFGVGGYSSAQELLTLQNRVWKYSPDLILLAVTTGNDISDNYRPLKRVGYVTGPRARYGLERVVERCNCRCRYQSGTAQDGLHCAVQHFGPYAMRQARRCHDPTIPLQARPVRATPRGDSGSVSL
jgi:GDSL-like lipase/acylhydrolase family protein